MGLTRPTVAQLNTVVTEISDPISVLNKGSTLANVDVGFVFNRDSGASPNVALYWNETLDSLVIAYTNSTGGVNSNIAVSSYANLTVGTMYGNIGGGSVLSNIYVTGSIIPTSNIAYDLGSPTQRWRSAYFSGNTIYIGGAILSTSGNDIVFSTTGGLGVPVGTTEQRTATQGALRFNTDTSSFEAYDGATWNTLAYGSVSDFPSGDYGDVTTITADAFGVASATTFDCNGEGATSTTDLGVLT